MTFLTRRTIGYAVYFALIAPPIGGVLTWLLAFVPIEILVSIKNGWIWKERMNLLTLLWASMIFSYGLGFFTAAIVGAIYGAYIREKSLKIQYIASFGTGITVQAIFLQTFGGNIFNSWSIMLTMIIIFAAGFSAVFLVAIKNLYLRFRCP